MNQLALLASTGALLVAAWFLLEISWNTYKLVARVNRDTKSKPISAHDYGRERAYRHRRRRALRRMAWSLAACVVLAGIYLYTA